MKLERSGGTRPGLLLVPAIALLVVGLYLATIAGAENQPTVRGGVYGPDTCDDIQQVIDTKITKAPKGKTESTKAKIEFEGFYCSSPDGEVSQDVFAFTCELDKGREESCNSPVRLKKLKTGKHAFSVAASFANGGSTGGDPSPDVAKWKVVD